MQADWVHDSVLLGLCLILADACYARDAVLNSSIPEVPGGQKGDVVKV